MRLIILLTGRYRGGADALLAASVFHYGEMSVNEVKQAMLKAGIEVRL